MFNADKNLMEKWGPVLEHESATPIPRQLQESCNS